MDYLHLIYDAIIVGVLAFFFLRGRKKGLILTLCGLAAFFVAALGARMASETFTPNIADMLQPHISSAMEEYLGSGLDKKIDNFLNANTSSDNPLASMLGKMGLYDDLIETIRSAVAGEAAKTAADTVAALARTAAEAVAGILVFVVAFLLIIALWFLISRALDLAAHLPIIHGLNRFLGGLFGLLQGMLILFLAAWVLRLMGNVIPQETAAKTILLKFFLSSNPITLITGI